jgi:hypothetical protein
MYKIEKKNYGFKLTFEGFIKEDEMAKWKSEVVKALNTNFTKFGVFVDMRTLKPLPAEAQTLLQEGQKLFKAKGMERSVVILANAGITMQFQRIAKQTGIYQWERYINATTNPVWEKEGLDWLEKAKDPDK